jgi:hypothetical protein
MSRITIPEDASVVLCAGATPLKAGEYEFALPSELGDLGLSDAWMRNFFASLLDPPDSSGNSEKLYVILAVQRNRTAGHWFFLSGFSPFQRGFRMVNGGLKNRMGSRIGHPARWPLKAVAPEVAAKEILAQLIQS